MQNYVFVIDSNFQPLNPIHPARARDLLNKNKAAVFRTYPFTLILKAAIENPSLKPYQLKIDPGAKVTGLAIIQGEDVIWAAELSHRGALIKKSLDSRRAARRNRRNRNTRYRQARFLNRLRPEGWIPPSLMHRVFTIETWVRRICKFVPVTEIVMELVRFDTSLLQNPEISGTSYQQGELFGYEVREYLLEKYSRECAYCGAKDVPLEVEHIHPKSKGGSDRVSNLCIACHKCNQKKADKDVAEFLKKKPEVLKRVIAQAKAPLLDAARSVPGGSFPQANSLAVNQTRWKLFETLKALGLPVLTSSGGRTKYNRCRLQLPKHHWIDAVCVGHVDELILRTHQPLAIRCKGQGGRQKAALNKHGYPIRHNPLRPILGWSTGDIVLATITSGKYRGEYIGRIAPKSNGNCTFTPNGCKAFSSSLKYMTRIHCKDGYEYGFAR